MTRTMWIAVFCLVTSGISIAVRVAAPASLFVGSVQHPGKTETGPVVDEAAKSDRLELPNIRPETKIIPASQALPVESPSSQPETATIPSRDWHDANAKIAPPEPTRRRPLAREPKKSAANKPPAPRAEAWHCRQDTMGSLLRSLDLSPRCNL
jgi:hypothetical protein